MIDKPIAHVYYSNKSYASTKRCEFPLCSKQPSFGPIGGKRARCKTHMKKDDVNLRSRKCQVEGCGITPCFGPILSTIAFRCKTHKFDSDVNLKTKRCIVEGCEITASFGPQGTRTMLRCLHHKLPDDINTKKSSISSKKEDDDEH